MLRFLLPALLDTSNTVFYLLNPQSASDTTGTQSSTKLGPKKEIATGMDAEG